MTAMAAKASTTARYQPELMEVAHCDALLDALKHLFENESESVWRAAAERAPKDGNKLIWSDVRVCVLPLDRIGAPKGASGAHVFVAYFADNRDISASERIPSSRPLVIKIGDHSNLIGENAVGQKWPTLDRDHEVKFAKPIYLHQVTGGLGVLVAPFQSDFTAIDGGGALNVKLNDLWGLLHNVNEYHSGKCLGAPPDWAMINQSVQFTIDTMNQVHKNHRGSIERVKTNLSSVFESYLRGVCDAAKRRHIPINLFGEQETVRAFGRTWQNPLRLADDLHQDAGEKELAMGPVHGDLHPKNIVLGHQGSVNIIDFGWVEKKAPVALDYLLLDINLRGVTLPSQLSQNDICSFASFLEPIQKIEKLPSTMQPRARIIKDTLWSRYQSNAAAICWRTEYLIPMFLVSFGLLVHLDNARNQTSLIATVLSLARKIRESS